MNLTEAADAEEAGSLHPNSQTTRRRALRNVPTVTVIEWFAAVLIVVGFAVAFTVGMASILAEDVGTAPQQSCANWFGSTAADSSCLP